MNASAAKQARDCPGCSRVVSLAPGEVDRLVAEYFAGRDTLRASSDTYRQRLSICDQCADLRFGTTCRHCGCLVAVRAAISDKACPAPRAKWDAE